MVRSFAVVAFIGAAAAAGIYVGTKETVMDGRVMAANLMEQVGKKGISSIDCPREIPIGLAGAVFTCAVAGTDGSTASIEYTMNRAGALAAKVVDSTGPTRVEPREPDPNPWD